MFYAVRFADVLVAYCVSVSNGARINRAPGLGYGIELWDWR